MRQRWLRNVSARLRRPVVPTTTPHQHGINSRLRTVALSVAAFLVALGIGATFISLLETHYAEK